MDILVIKGDGCFTHDHAPQKIYGGEKEPEEVST
jgi:hypothetical protein